MVEVIKNIDHFLGKLDEKSYIISYINTYSTSVLNKDWNISYLVDGWPVQIYLLFRFFKKTQLLAYRDYNVHFFNKTNVKYIIIGYRNKELQRIQLNMKHHGLKIVAATNGYQAENVIISYLKSLKIDKSTVILIGQGQPKQELLALKINNHINDSKILCVGAGLSQQFGTSKELL